MESCNVGDGFEGSHGDLLLMGTKKPAEGRVRGGAGVDRSGVVRGMLCERQVLPSFL